MLTSVKRSVSNPQLEFLLLVLNDTCSDVRNGKEKKTLFILSEDQRFSFWGPFSSVITVSIETKLGGNLSR